MKKSKRSRRPLAYSLMEAILASFLLIGVFLLVGKMFHRGLQYSSVVNERVTAVHIAEQQMARVRRQVEETGEWTAPVAEFPEHPEYKVDVRLDGVRLYSPSSKLEEAYPPSTRRTIGESSKKVSVIVSWGRGEAKRFVLTSLVNQPPRRWRTKNSIVIKRDRGNSPIRPGQSIRYVATGYDEDGKEIKDLFFQWNVVPVYGEDSAVGRVRQSHNGSIGVLGNRVQTVEGELLDLQGFCKITATALLDGQLKTVVGPEERLSY